MTEDLKQQAREFASERGFDDETIEILMAAFAEHVLSQQSATPQGISEEGKGLGDAAQSSGPGSARVPSDYRPADAASLIPIAPAHRPSDRDQMIQQLVEALNDELKEAAACGKPCHGFQYAKDALRLAEQQGFKPRTNES